MSRVALVTGGTRGIGAAIAKALKAAGYKVAANYGGKDEAAAKFKAETGIPVFKWDVSSFEACAEGIKKVEAELGPVEVLGRQLNPKLPDFCWQWAGRRATLADGENVRQWSSNCQTMVTFTGDPFARSTRGGSWMA
jgi:NAD(P)-dependent dehydrogenase (short-subunit alcohol dehydrogenase family)